MVHPLTEHVDDTSLASEVFEIQRQDGERLCPLPFEYIEGLVVAGCLRASDEVLGRAQPPRRLGAWPRLDRAFEAQQQRAIVGASLAAFTTPKALMAALGLEPSTVRKVMPSGLAPRPAPETSPTAKAPPPAAAEWVDFDPFAGDE